MSHRSTVPNAQAAVSQAAILDYVAQPVWVVDAHGTVIFVNAAAVAAFGYDDLDELRGRCAHDTVHYKRPDGSPYPARDCPLSRALRERKTLHSEEDWFVRRDGSLFCVSYTSTPIELPTGPGAVVTFADMEEQRRAELALLEREAILETVAQPVWVVDHRGCFHYANPAALAAVGYEDLSELKGKPGHQLVHYKYPDGTPFPEEDCPVTRARLTGEPLQEHEDWLVRKDGSILRISFSTAPFELPGGRGSVTAFTDVEEQLEAEKAARDRDVAEARSAELRRARRRIIEAADAARAQLERDLHDGAQQQFVTLALQLRVARSKLPSEPALAARLLDDAIEMNRTALAELRRLAAGIHPAILTNRGLGAALDHLAMRLPLPVSVVDEIGERLPASVEASLYFVVSEALTNVVKHAHASHASVRIAADNGHLVLEVSDDGVGGAQIGGGTGLSGLADRIAALDGELAVSSTPSSGTTLRAEVRLRPEPAATPAADVGQPG